MREFRSEIALILDGKGFYTYTPFTDTDYLKRNKIKFAELDIRDERIRTEKQNRFIHALLRDIDDYTGQGVNYLKEFFKVLFYFERGLVYKSTADLDVTTANEFCLYLLEFIIAEGIPVKEDIISKCPDIARYVYMCALYGKCCITGQKGEIHHIDAVGMGRDRKEIYHIGMRALPLCREKHTEFHAIGASEFYKKYHIEPIKLDEKICKANGLNYK